MPNYRSAFHQELQNIEIHVVQLFVFVAEDIGVATDALLGRNAEGFQVVSERETLIDGLYRQVETLLNRELVLEAPVAADFRLLISMVRVVPELERSHDLVADIAEHSTHMLNEELSPRARGLVQSMGDTAGGMWNRVATAWQERDAGAAETILERDDDLDSLHAALLAELASGRMSLPVAMDMTLVARYYERLGDHAVNIARRVAYIAGSTTDTRSSDT
jgi:phosphate transport system protein